MGRKPLFRSGSIAQFEPLETRRLYAAFSAHVDFTPSRVAPSSGYVADNGKRFGDRGNGLVYGWNVNETQQLRFHRSKPAADTKSETAVILRLANKRRPADTWQLQLPNGQYTVHVETGDGTVGWGRSQVEVNGSPVLDGMVNAKRRWLDSTFVLTVSNGTLSVSSGLRSRTNRLAFIDVVQIVPDASTLPGGPSTPTLPADPTPTDPTPTMPAVPTTPDPAPANPVSPVTSPAVDLSTLKWHAVAPIPVGLTEAMGEGVHGKLYVFGGYTDTSYLPSTRVYCYDPVANAWTRKTDMPIGTTHTGTAVDGQYIYFAGGYPPDNVHHWQIFATTAVWRYDTVNDSWLAMPALPEGRGAGNMAIVGSVLHYFSGADITRVDRHDHWALDLNNLAAGWVTKAPIPTARNHVGAGALNGIVYAIGGASKQDAAETALNVVETYDPATDKWSTVAPLPTPRALTMSGVDTFANRIIIGGGETAYNVPTSQITAYDPATNTWTQLTPIPQKRTSGVFKSLGTSLIFTTGHPGFNTDTWIGTFG